MADSVLIHDDRLTIGGQGFGHRVIVVKQTTFAGRRAGLGEAGVFIDGVVRADPAPGGFDARIVVGNAGVDHALEAGVGHAAVAAEEGAAVGAGVLAGGIAAGLAVVEIDEPAVVAGPFLVVGLGVVLAAGGEFQGGLKSRVAGFHAGVVKRVQCPLRVGKIGPAAAAVAEAAEFGIALGNAQLLGHAFDAIGPLEGAEVIERLVHRRLIVGVVRGGEGGDSNGGVVIGQQIDVDPAVGKLIAQELVESLMEKFNVGVKARVLHEGFEGQGADSQRIDFALPTVIGLLTFFEIIETTIDDAAGERCGVGG